MKRFLLLLIASIMIAATLASCGVSPQNNGSDPSSSSSIKKLSIVTTIFPPYDFTKQIAGHNADVSMLLKPGSESHAFEPTPQDIKKIQNADLFIYTGGENDVWVEGILSSMGDKHPDTLKLMDIVPLLEEETVPGMEPDSPHEDSHHPDSAKDDHDHVGKKDHNHLHQLHDHNDEHVWTSPQNAILIIKKTSQILIAKDAANKSAYESQSAAYIKELEDLDNGFRNVVSTGQRKTLIFGDRFPFRYFAHEYGLSYFAPFFGCSPNTEASAATVAFLVDKVKAEKIPVVFTIELSNSKIADSIAQATGAKTLEFHSCHNITPEEFSKGATYLSIMKKNVHALQEALN